MSQEPTTTSEESKNDDTQELFVEAQKLYTAGNFTPASNILNILVKRQPKNASIYATLGSCYGVSGKWDKAIEYFEKAVQLEDKNVTYRLALLSAYAQLEAPDYLEKTLLVLDGLANMNVEQILGQNLHAFAGNLCIEQGDPAKAVEYLTIAVEMEPQNEDYKVKLGEAIQEDAKFKKAISSAFQSVANVLTDCLEDMLMDKHDLRNSMGVDIWSDGLSMTNDIERDFLEYAKRRDSHNNFKSASEHLVFLQATDDASDDAYYYAFKQKLEEALDDFVAECLYIGISKKHLKQSGINVGEHLDGNEPFISYIECTP